MMGTTISVITVTRNNASTIPDCLASVRGQSYPREHVVIDGLSCDGTRDILIRERSSIDVLVSEEDAGIYDAMNKGLRHATGDVVGTLNADDVYAGRGVLERVARTFEDDDVDACYGDLLYVEQTDGKAPVASGGLVHENAFALPAERVVRRWKSGPLRPGSFQRGWMPPHPTFFVRRRFYEELGAYRLDMGTAADYELMLRFMVKHRLRVAYLPETLVKMRCGGASNRTMKNRLLANRMDRRAWAVNGLKPYPWTLWMKPLRKLPQWIRAASWA